MTDLDKKIAELRAGAPEEWLIRKEGFWYRPKKQGYTTRKIEAGRYTRADAEREARIEPWHMSAVHQDEVPDEPAIADLKTENATLTARVAELEAALEPFADFADYLAVETEGFADTDDLDVSPSESSITLFRFKVGDYRRARSALKGEK